MKKINLILIFALLILLGGFFWLMRQQNDSPSVSITSAEEARFADASKINYTSDQGDISVEYVGDLARIQGGVYDGVVLRQVVSASGAKYEGDQGVSLWTKNNEVRIETPQQVVYTGMALMLENQEVPPVVAEETTPATTSTSTIGSSVTFTEKTWMWQSAVQAGETLQPKKADAFSLMFMEDGTVRGTTDCNGFGGNYTTTDDTVTLGALQMTLMFCENSEESLFVHLLESPLMVTTMNEKNMELKNATGDTLQFTAKE